MPTEAPAAAETTTAPAAESLRPICRHRSTATGRRRRPHFRDRAWRIQAGYEVDEEFLAGAANALGIKPGKGKTVGSTDQVSGQLTLDFSGATPQISSGEFQVTSVP